MRKGNRGLQQVKRAGWIKRVRAAADAGAHDVAESFMRLLAGNVGGTTRRRVPYKRPENICLLDGCMKVHIHANSFCCADHPRQWNEANPNKGKKPAVFTKQQLAWMQSHKLKGGRLDYHAAGWPL